MRYRDACRIALSEFIRQAGVVEHRIAIRNEIERQEARRIEVPKPFIPYRSAYQVTGR